MPFTTYTNEQMIVIACNYAQAVYKNTASETSDAGILDVCYLCAKNTNDPVYTDPIDAEPLLSLPSPDPFTLAQILSILADIFFSWDGCEPRADILEGIFPGGIGRPASELCPVFPEATGTADQISLKQNIGYYHHLLWARTYYFDLCKMSQLYISYKKYLDSDLMDLTALIEDYVMDDGTNIVNGVNPTNLLNEWKNTTAPEGKITFSQWLYTPQERDCTALTLDDVLICMKGVADCNNFTEDDSWWKLNEYGSAVPISANLGIDTNYIGINETRHITYNDAATAVLRVSWEDLWTPFAGGSDLVTFSQYVSGLTVHGPTVVSSPGGSQICLAVGACCTIDDCTENTLACHCSGVANSWWKEAEPCGNCIIPYSINAVSDIYLSGTDLEQERISIDVLEEVGSYTTTLALLASCSGAAPDLLTDASGVTNVNDNIAALPFLCNDTISIVTDVTLDQDNLRVEKTTVKVLAIKAPISDSNIDSFVACAGTNIANNITPVDLTTTICGGDVYTDPNVTDVVVVTDVYIESEILKQRKATITVLAHSPPPVTNSIISTDDCASSSSSSSSSSS
jgi:hypothetical protein